MFLLLFWLMMKGWRFLKLFFFFGSIVKMMMMKTEIHSDCLKMQTKQQQQQIADIDNQSDQLIFLETNKTKQKTSSLFTNNLYIFFTSWCIFLQKFRISLDVCVEKKFKNQITNNNNNNDVINTCSPVSFRFVFSLNFP